MRGISRQVLARDAAWTLADGACKELTLQWAQWEKGYLAADAIADRAVALVDPAAVCAGCPIIAECAELAELSQYSGIAAGQGYRNGGLDTFRLRGPSIRQRRTA